MRPKARDDLTVVEIEGEAVIYDPEEDLLHHLNQSAAIALAVCDGTGTTEELAQDIAAVSNQHLDQVLDEVRHMVHHFEDLGLLEGSVASWNREPEPEMPVPPPAEVEEPPTDPANLEDQETLNH